MPLKSELDSCGAGRVVNCNTPCAGFLCSDMIQPLPSAPLAHPPSAAI